MWEVAGLLQPRPFLNKLSNALVSRKFCEWHMKCKRFAAMGKCCENIFQIYILVAALAKKFVELHEKPLQRVSAALGNSFLIIFDNPISL
jgi:hypothetical protein